MKKYLLALFILTLPAITSLFRPGSFPYQDDLQAFRLLEMKSCFVDGQLPCRWTPQSGFGYGYPLFQYYAPAIFYFGQPFLFLGLQAIDTVKILFILAAFTGSFGIFFVIRRLSSSSPVALSASVIYTYLPYHAQQLYVRGSLNEYWAGALYPWVLLFALRLIEKPTLRRVSLFAIFLGILLITHNLMSVFLLPIIIIFIKNLRSLIGLIFGGLISIGLAAFFILPLIFENTAAHLETLIGGYFGYRQHFVSLSQLYLSNNWGYGSSQLGPGDDLSLAIGIALLASVIFISIFLLLRKKLDAVHLLLLLTALGMTFLIHEKSVFIWETAKPLAWLQFPWRMLLPIGFALTLSLYPLSKVINKKYLPVFSSLLLLTPLFLHGIFFNPKSWDITITDASKFSGANLITEQTRSVFDYLPKSAILPPNRPAEKAPEILDTAGVISYWHKGSNWQSGQLTLLESSAVRLPIYDFPGMEVKIDTKIVPHINTECRGQDYCFGLVTTQVPAGTHDVSVSLTKTPSRLVGDVITISALLLVLLLLCLG